MSRPYSLADWPKHPEKDQAFQTIRDRLSAIGFSNLITGSQDWEYLDRRGDIDVAFESFLGGDWRVIKIDNSTGYVRHLLYFEHMDANEWIVYDRIWVGNSSTRANCSKYSAFGAAFSDFIARL